MVKCISDLKCFVCFSTRHEWERGSTTQQTAAIPMSIGAMSSGQNGDDPGLAIDNRNMDCAIVNCEPVSKVTT